MRCQKVGPMATLHNQTYATECALRPSESSMLDDQAGLDLETFDDVLANKLPFSEPTYLFDCTVRRYRERLTMLIPSLPFAVAVANQLANASREIQRKVLGDPATRSAINQALANMSFVPTVPSPHSLDEIGEVIQLAGRELGSKDAVPVLQLGSSANNSVSFFQDPVWFWTNEREHDSPTSLFRKLYARQEEGKSILVTPTLSERESVINAVRLMANTCPKLAKSVLYHVNLICICDVPEDSKNNQKVHFESFTTILIPGTVFISRHMLCNTWLLAEAILHEALHTKLYDCQHTHSLFLSQDAEMTTPILSAVWNRPTKDGDDRWTLNRSLFAFHVYVHLAIYLCKLRRDVLILEASFGPCGYTDLGLSARRAFDRAHYLGQNIDKHKHRLGVAGQALLNWLSKMLRDADTKPPATDSYVHLVLDLYHRETLDMINQARKSVTADTAIAADKVSQIDSEIKLTQTLISILGLRDNVSHNDDYSQSASKSGLDALVMQRTRIAKILSQLSQDQCTQTLQLRSGPITVGEVVRGIVLDPKRYARVI